jgi:hypothetical protein
MDLGMVDWMVELSEPQLVIWMDKMTVFVLVESRDCTMVVAQVGD